MYVKLYMSRAIKKFQLRWWGKSGSDPVLKIDAFQSCLDLCKTFGVSLQ